MSAATTIIAWAVLMVWITHALLEDVLRDFDDRRRLARFERSHTVSMEEWCQAADEIATLPEHEGRFA